MTTDHQDARFWRERAREYEQRRPGIFWGICTRISYADNQRLRGQLYAVGPSPIPIGFWWTSDVDGFNAERATACAFLAALCEAGAFDEEGNLR